MEGNDITTHAPIRCGCVFEGVLASPPKGVIKQMRAATAARQYEWNRHIGMWVPHEMAIKSLVDLVNRRQVGVEVYTTMPYEATHAIDGWLFRKGVSVPVYSYGSYEKLAQDLRYHHPSMVVYVATEDQASAVGVKASVVPSGQAWSF